mmetsp:Transcript_4740/g.20346  ORF Transcript_4740/g.20346 Transcript_4740/m.20346 type:complete len:114 (-) Transcript_4740:1548-1889(-)
MVVFAVSLCFHWRALLFYYVLKKLLSLLKPTNEQLDKEALENIYTFTWVYIDQGPTKFVNKSFELYTNHSYGQGGLYHLGSHPKFMRSEHDRFYKHLQTHAIANGQDPDGSFE